MKIVAVMFILLFYCSCGQKKNVKLARNYYKMAMLELASQDNADKQMRKSLAHLEKALTHDDQPHYRAVKATLLLKLKQEQESLKEFNELLKTCHDPHLKTEILNNYACALAEAGWQAKALEIWQSLETDKDYLTPEVALMNQGKMHAQSNDFAQAKALFCKALAFAPGYLDAHYYLALVALALQDHSLAKNEVKTMLFLEPEHPGIKKLAQELGLIV